MYAGLSLTSASFIAGEVYAGRFEKRWSSPKRGEGVGGPCGANGVNIAKNGSSRIAAVAVARVQPVAEPAADDIR